MLCYLGREPPAIEIYPDHHQTIVVGGSALLQCRTISGIPSPSVVWRRSDGRPLSPSVEELPNGVLRYLLKDLLGVYCIPGYLLSFVRF